MKTTLRKILWGFLVIVIVQSACTISPVTVTQISEGDTPVLLATPTLSEPTPTTVATPPEGIYPPPFATYSEISVRLPQTFSGGYTLPLDLGQVGNMDMVQLSDAQRSLLAQNGFVVTTPEPGQFREFYQVYEMGRYNDMPMFVTSDSVYHVYHLLFDKMLRDLETGYFISGLKLLSSSKLAASYQQYQSLGGSPLQEPARRNVAYFAVAAQLLGLPDLVPTEVTDLVSAELALINAANGVRPAVAASSWKRNGGQVRDLPLVLYWVPNIRRIVTYAHECGKTSS
jgi:hypothetical protein